MLEDGVKRNCEKKKKRGKGKRNNEHLRHPKDIVVVAKILRSWPKR
jgi:hypothetical protein